MQEGFPTAGVEVGLLGFQINTFVGEIGARQRRRRSFGDGWGKRAVLAEIQTQFEGARCGARGDGAADGGCGRRGVVRLDDASRPVRRRHAARFQCADQRRRGPLQGAPTQDWNHSLFLKVQKTHARKLRAE